MKHIRRTTLLVSASLGSLVLGVSGAAAQATSEAAAQPSSGTTEQAASKPAASAPAPVATPADGGEILVTGSRLREEAVQDVPVTVSVLNSRAVESLHATNITALTGMVPNLVIAEQGTSPGVGGVFIRGFGTFSADPSIEPGITVYVDGVYQAVAAGSISNLFDIERVEVLRGPQSSLLGKNASAGAVLITHTRPNTHQFSGKVEAETGRYGLAQFQALLNVPVVEDKVAIKLYALEHHRGSYLRNLFPGKNDEGGEDTQIIRGGVLLTPSPDISLYVSADYEHDHPEQLTARDTTPPTGLPCTVFGYCTNQAGQYHVINTNFVARDKTNDYHLTADFDWNLGPVKLASITGYRHRTILNQADVDSGPLTLLHIFDNRYYIDSKSQEVRLSPTSGGGLNLGGRLSWVIGGFFTKLRAEDAQPYMTQASPAAAIVMTTQAQRSDRKTYAAFAQAEYNLTDALSISGGARRSKDEVLHRFDLRVLGSSDKPDLPYSQSRTDNNTSLEGSLKYKIDPTKMIYFRYAEGYRGGGFIGRPSSLAQAAGGFGPETSVSYEIGSKTEFFDRRLLLNLTLYTVKFNDLQRTVVIPNGAAITTLTANVAKARTQGFEAETVLRPSRNFNVRGTVGYLDAKYLSYISNGTDLSDTPFVFAPRWTASLTPSYEIQMDGKLLDTVALSATYSYKSGLYVSTSIDANAYQKHYGFVDAQATFTRGTMELTLYVNDVTGKHWKTNAQTIGSLTAPTAQYVNDNIGRIWGISVQKTF